MSVAQPIQSPLSRHLRKRREKIFGDGRPHGLDRNAKARIMARARALSHKTEKGKHYGIITAKTLAVLAALLWGFHNARSGICFPSYKTIAKRAKCARSTVNKAIKTLEEAGILSWVNRLARIKERYEDFLGRFGVRTRVIRISNAYHFHDHGTENPNVCRNKSSKSEIQVETSNQELLSLGPSQKSTDLNPSNPLEAALLSLGKAIRALP